MGLLIKLLLIALSAYLLLAFALFFGQRRLIYVQDRHHTPPEEAGLTNVVERRITTPDGAELVAWYVKAPPDRPTVLYFHGNGGTLAGRAERVQAFQDIGLGLLIVSYRGYSGGTGSPSEPRNTRDARQAYDLLISQGVPAKQIVVYGESIGTGVATRLAHDVRVGGLILDSPFTSLVDLATQLYPYVPVRLFIRDRYPVQGLIDSIDAPLLVLHGAKDPVIPIRMSRAVYEAAREPKDIVVFADGEHSNLFDHGAASQIKAFVDRLSD